ncbi:MAG TPA: hypothetical protein PK180_09900, partial [Kiritimatiellia bacterium]|nr:hypothetical protein [Verrucomicrobiota bacterium]HQG75597.1 hypothetical protein [Kiritimatiellia bacterium]HOH41365.1 hypothetical protein [Verrucomicrobiota bacterium]HPK99350.1 hypothetical protein [Verrucomicrobiota bacterium]HPV12065.1 hypothetical protein [Verrucomicrobiota bacterium]
EKKSGHFLMALCQEFWIHELVERNIRYLESAIVDAQRQGQIDDGNPRLLATRVYSTTLGFSLHAKIRNDLRLLRDLKPAVMAIVRARGVAA